MLNRTALVILSALVMSAHANDFTYDFDQDNICDSYTVERLEKTGDLNTITIHLGKKKDISGIFSTGLAGIASGYFSSEIIIPQDFYSPQSVQQSTYTFRWSHDLENFVLYKESNWSEPYRGYSVGDGPIPTDALFPTDFEIHRINCCVLLSDFNGKTPPYQISDRKQTLFEIRKDIKILSKAIRSGEEVSLFFKKPPFIPDNRKPVPPDLVYEISTALTAENVETLNNYAFYMQKFGSNVLANILLRRIYEKYPRRVATKINLADSYWEINSKKESCSIYNEYIQDMLRTGKGHLIPSRANIRANCKNR